jgi:hypothetical protein
LELVSELDPDDGREGSYGKVRLGHGRIVVLQPVSLAMKRGERFCLTSSVIVRYNSAGYVAAGDGVLLREKE